MDDRVKQLLVVGREHYAHREFEKAEELLRQVLDHDDRFADVHDMLGVICHARSNFIQAERHFERALEINPSYTEAALNLAVTYNDRGKYKAAKQIYKRIKGGSAGTAEGLDPFARGKLANMHADIAQAYADAGMPHDAIGELEKAVNLCPQFADLQTKLGGLLRDVHNLPRAKETYEAALAARPNFVPALLQLGVTLLAMGDASGAEERWRSVARLEPDNSRAKMYLRMLATGRSSPPSG